MRNKDDVCNELTDRFAKTFCVFSKASIEYLLPGSNIVFSVLQEFDLFKKILFIDNFAEFLASSNINNDREAAIERLKSLNKKELEYIQLYLLENLSKYDAPHKARIYGFIFSAFIGKTIEFSNLARIYKALDLIFTEDLRVLGELKDDEFINDERAESLVYAGLLRENGIDYGILGIDDGGVKYELTSIGKDFFNILKSNKWFEGGI